MIHLFIFYILICFGYAKMLALHYVHLSLIRIMQESIDQRQRYRNQTWS